MGHRATTAAGASAAVLATATLLSACAAQLLPAPDKLHLRAEDISPSVRMIPPPVRHTIALPRPSGAATVETYSVVVNNVRVQDLLFALARDARLNIDVHPGIQGTVTLNAIDQTLQQILARVTKQVGDIRWELDGRSLAVMPDTPFLRTYGIDYVSMSRDASGSISVSTQVGSATWATGGAQTSSSATSGGNVSSTRIDNVARNHFWESLERNVKDILHETDKILPEGSSETLIERSDSQATTGGGAAARGAGQSVVASASPVASQQQGTTVVKRATFREAASVIINPESGLVVIRATSRQHEKVQEFLDQVAASARRQVMIEATIAEVRLSDRYQKGINWQSLRSQRSDGGRSAGFQMAQKPTGTVNGAVPDPLTGTATAGAAFLLNYVAPGLGISATISLLETFGNVRVLSSPKIGVLNNQTAVLKVVNNTIYFDIKADTTTSSTGLATTSVTTTPRSVSVGLVMTVTPQISDSDIVLLNVRPSISRISGSKNDPNPNIPAGLVNAVPEIETREMESVLRLADGEIAVMGGLMQDSIDHTTNEIPGLAGLPLIGSFFRQRDETTTKTELVVFLRPHVIRSRSSREDRVALREQLPGAGFFGSARSVPK